MHYYQKNIPDFNNATRHLTRVERSLYSDAIEMYYDTELPLILDIKKLERLLLAQSGDEKDALKNVLDEFFTLTDDGYFNKRCNEEVVKYQSFMLNQSKAGKASAEHRANKILSGVGQVLNGGSSGVGQVLNGGSSSVEQLLSGGSSSVEQLLSGGSSSVQPTNTQYPIPNTKEPVTINQEQNKTKEQSQNLTEPQNCGSEMEDKNADNGKQDVKTPPELVAATPKKAAKPKPEKTEFELACLATRDAYSGAYLRRYGAEPVFNATVYSQIKNFVKRIGYVESPLMAAWYLDSNDSYHARNGHSFGLLLNAAEKLRTDWITKKLPTQQPETVAQFKTAAQLREENNNAVGDRFIEKMLGVTLNKKEITIEGEVLNG